MQPFEVLVYTKEDNLKSTPTVVPVTTPIFAVSREDALALVYAELGKQDLIPTNYNVAIRPFVTQ